MEQHWSNYCKMGIVHFMAFPATGSGQGPIVESVKKIAGDDFFDAIEVTWIRDAAARREVREILEISQLQVGFCAHPAILSQQLDLNSLDEDRRRAAVGQMKTLVNQASELGACRFVFMSGPDPGERDREPAIEALVDSICQVCAYGEERGIGMTLETFDRQVDKKALIGPVQVAARVAETVKADYADFGLLYDLSHMPILGETPADMAAIREHLVHVHVGNCVAVGGRPLYGDQHPYFGFPGGANGVDELAEFIRGLFEIGYLAAEKDPKPWVGFEVKPHGHCQTPELVIANAKRTWRQAWGRV